VLPAGIRCDFVRDAGRAPGSGFGTTLGLHRSQRLSSSPWMHSVTG
jgi:hypothetical protein